MENMKGRSVFAFGEVGLVTSVGVQRGLGGQAMSCEVDLHGTGGRGVCWLLVRLVFHVDYGVLLAFRLVFWLEFLEGLESFLEEVLVDRIQV